MFEKNESDSKEPGIVKHSINTLMFRSLKRTHDLFVASQALSIPTHDQSSKLRKSCKINSEYSAVKHLPPPNETIARISSKTESGPVLGPHNPFDIETNIPNEDNSNREVYKGSTSLATVCDNNPLKSALALKAITTEKPAWHAPWKLYRVISGHLGWVRCIDVDPSNDWFITGSTDRTIKIWDLATSTLRLSLTGHISTIRAVKVSHRHTYFFSAGEDKQIKCWDLEQNKTIRQYHGHLSAVYGLALHPRLDVLISCGRDSTARVWDIRTKACIFTLSGHTNTVACVESQAPNPQIITGSHDSTIRLWDLTAGKTHAILTNHKKSIRALALHPEEFTFTSASPDVIKQWRFPDGNFMQNMTGQTGIVNCMAVNPDGVLVSGGDNGSLFFWDWRTGYNFQKAQTIVQPGSLDSEAGLFCMTFDKSGTRLLVGEADKTIKVYKQDESADEESHPVVWKSEILRAKKY